MISLLSTLRAAMAADAFWPSAGAARARGPVARPTVVPASGRRHGDPFPLPVDFLHERALSPGRLRRCVGALTAMNHLAAATDNSRRGQGHDASPLAGRRPTRVQQWMLDSVVRRVTAYGAPPPDLSEEDSLAELLEARDLYSIEP